MSHDHEPVPHRKPADDPSDRAGPAITADGQVMLTLAISDYDQVRDLTSGRIKPDGIRLNCLDLQIEEIFYRFTKFREWEVSEMSMAKYVSLLSSGDRGLTGIPVFPSRVFRHSSIYVLRESGVREPGDLTGKRVGLPEWAQTASIYTRGMLHHQYGIDLTSIDWLQAGVNQTGRVEKVALKLPEGVRYRSCPDKTLNGMLLSGEVDAVMTAHPPEAFKRGDPRVIRMFENYREVEEAYCRETGIFPIMHIIAIRREVIDRHPWVARNLFKAFEEAKDRSVRRALEATASRFPIPWSFDCARNAQELLGEDYWPYGIEKNRTTLEAFLAFAHEQGVCHRRLEVEELFPETMRSAFRV